MQGVTGSAVPTTGPTRELAERDNQGVTTDSANTAQSSTGDQSASSTGSNDPSQTTSDQSTTEGSSQSTASDQSSSTDGSSTVSVQSVVSTSSVDPLTTAGNQPINPSEYPQTTYSGVPTFKMTVMIAGSSRLTAVSSVMLCGSILFLAPFLV